jgi:glycine cleavage system regulatory protein
MLIRNLFSRAISKHLCHLPKARSSRADSKDPEKYFEEDTYRNYVIESYNSVGILSKIMRLFNSNNIDITYIDNQFYNKEKDGTHRVDFNISATPLDNEQLHIIENKLA